MSAAVHSEPGPERDRYGRSKAKATAQDFADFAKAYAEGEAQRADKGSPFLWVDPESFPVPFTRDSPVQPRPVRRSGRRRAA